MILVVVLVYSQDNICLLPLDSKGWGPNGQVLIVLMMYLLVGSAEEVIILTHYNRADLLTHLPHISFLVRCCFSLPS